MRAAASSRPKGTDKMSRAVDDIAVERARPDDADAIRTLLLSHGLPVDDVESHLGSAIVARHNGEVVGCAALELYRDGALLRSVAVSPDLKGRGLGRRLTEAMIDHARALGQPALYLLTTTAQTYFPAFGFDEIERSSVPASVQASVEFKSACPSSAIVMRKDLASEPN